jgi:glutamate synthase domain-containing protein 3
MDERGLVELDDSIPKQAKIDGQSAVIEARDMTTRKINAELRWLVYEEGVTDVTVRDPSARHSLGVAILARCRIRFEGSLGYFGCGLIDGPEVEITGRVGWSVAENMMSGVVIVENNAGSLAGAALRGGDLVVKGDVGARTGIDQKGGTIIVLGNAASMTGFICSRGRQIILGDVGPRAGDSDVRRHHLRRGRDRPPRHRLRGGRLDGRGRRLVERKFSIYGLGRPPDLRKFVSGKKLYNYDNLEPSERKLVL